MKNIILQILISFIPLVFMYLIASFINITFDFKQWSEAGRFFVSVLGLFFGVVLFLSFQTDKTK